MRYVTPDFVESVYSEFMDRTIDAHPSMSVQALFDRVKIRYPVVTGVALQSALEVLHKSQRLDCREGLLPYSEVYRVGRCDDLT